MEMDDYKREAIDMIAHEDWAAVAELVHRVNNPEFTRFVLKEAHWYGAVFN